MSSTIWIQLFPAGIADGELQGTWIMERMVKNDIGGFDPVRNDVSVYVADGSTQSASYDFSNGSEGSLIDNPRSIGQLEADAEQSDEYSVWSITSNSLATWNKTSDGSYQLVLPYYGGTLPIVFRLE